MTTAAEPVGEPPASPPTAPETGHRGVDAALGPIADLEGRPTAEHVGVYDEAHRRLEAALADLDES